jgi:hypothetical protein
MYLRPVTAAFRGWREDPNNTVIVIVLSAARFFDQLLCGQGYESTGAN